MNEEGGGDQPVEPDWSQLQQTRYLIQQNPTDPHTLLAVLGVDMSQQQGDEGEGSEGNQYA